MEQTELGSYLKNKKNQKTLKVAEVKMTQELVTKQHSGTFTVLIWPSVVRPLISEGDKRRLSSSGLCKLKTDCHASGK